MDLRVQDRFMGFVAHVTQLVKELNREDFSGMPLDIQVRLRQLGELYQKEKYIDLILQVEKLLEELEKVELDYVMRQQGKEHLQASTQIGEMLGVVNLQKPFSSQKLHFTFFHMLREQLQEYNVHEHQYITNRVYGFFGWVEIILIVLLGGLLLSMQLHLISFFMLWYCTAVLALAGTVILLFRRTKTGAGLVLTLLLVLGMVGGWHFFF